MIKKIGIICLCIILSLCSACNFLGKSNTQQTVETENILYSATDATGMTLTFSDKPQRIISLNVSIDEIILDLVDTERIVALSSLADDPSICSAGDKVKAVQGRVSGNDLEEILMLQPDLILVPDYSTNLINNLRSLGLKVYVCKTPNDIKDIFAFICEIGNAIGEKQKAEDMASSLENKMLAIRLKIAQAIPANKQISIAALSFTGPLGSRGTFNDLCYYAGVKNCFADNDMVYEGILPQELLLQANPDMIITPSWDFAGKNDPNIFRQDILDNPVYQNLTAIKNQRVYIIHSNWLNSTSQYVYFSVKEIASLAYTELDF